METIRRWPSVRAGENKWIFPYQENADVMFNTAMLFELAVIKSQAEPLLELVPENADEHAEAYRLLKFLKYIAPIQNRQLPPTSLLRSVAVPSNTKVSCTAASGRTLSTIIYSGMAGDGGTDAQNILEQSFNF